VATASRDPGLRQRILGLGAEVLALPSEDGRVDLPALLDFLGKREITSLLVEGGGTLLGSLFDMRLVDKVIAFIAPLVIGGQTALSPVEGSGIAQISQALRLERVKVQELGGDLMVSGYTR
jgi:diaminohydroxyphosphoribosylaminopyrimidine deaminase/5-amino-6-(5-phosphoribosylamino)uracil reductase